MKILDLNNKSKEELVQLLEGLREKLLKLNFDMADSKVKDFSQLKKAKKDIARILTAIEQSKSSISKS